jgi:hypothetical protein
MERRDFLKTASAAGALTLLPFAKLASAQAGGASADTGASARRDSGQAYSELAQTLQQVEADYLSAERGITRPGDVSDGRRFILHVLQTGLFLRFEYDPERPSFRRIISPTRKLLGDQPDAIYFEAPIRGDRRYRIRGNTAGAVYTSFTIEGGAWRVAIPSAPTVRSTTRR